MKFHRARICRLLSLAAMLSLAACASTTDAAHPEAELWRVGYIDHDVTLNESTPLVRFSQDCRDILPSTQTMGVRWVMLHFRRPPEEVFRIVPLPDGQQLAEGQKVYVKVDECTRTLEPR
ncbi:MAG: hypothetical protein EPO09_02115 [Aquabacterium sp.]|uniref:hypothetical protein n=1 Tax=Aquabacterium sp. TaxID=1872578 RepID=UPI001228B09B|nr:hypothetical protein [Aquabacterium sp.]TAK98695.1 MAG: hypothetical protein EPO09_02115 [Aquabacterium sp.]